MTDPVYAPKSYVIGTREKERFAPLCAKLEPYGPVPFTLIPYCSVTVRSETEERSLLELLADTPGVEFHPAGEHRALPSAKLVKLEARALREGEGRRAP